MVRPCCCTFFGVAAALAEHPTEADNLKLDLAPGFGSWCLDMPCEAGLYGLCIMRAHAQTSYYYAPTCTLSCTQQSYRGAFYDAISAVPIFHPALQVYLRALRLGVPGIWPQFPLVLAPFFEFIYRMGLLVAMKKLGCPPPGNSGK